MKKILLFLGLLTLFASCSQNYYVEITHNDGITNVIILDDNNPKIIKGNLQSQCGCSTYDTNVKSFKVLRPVNVNNKRIINDDLLSLIIKILIFFSFMLFLFNYQKTRRFIYRIFGYIPVLKSDNCCADKYIDNGYSSKYYKYIKINKTKIKQKDTFMKKVLMTITYGVVIILFIKIGIILIKYLPPYIETFLK